MEAALLIKIDAEQWVTADLHKRGKGAGVGKASTKEDTEMFNWNEKKKNNQPIILWQHKSYTKGPDGKEF